MAFGMQVLGTRVSRCMITMGKRNRSNAFRRCIHAKRACVPSLVGTAANRLVGSHPENEFLLLRGLHKVPAAVERLTTVASAGPKELV